MSVSLLSQAYLTKEEIKLVITNIILFKSEDWKIYSPICMLLQILAFNHSILIDPESLSQLINFILELLKHPQIEVATTAKRTLSSLIRTFNVRIEPLLSDLIIQYTELSYTPLSKTNKKESIPKRLNGILGLTAIAESVPYTVPSWLPEVLVTIADHTDDKDPPTKKLSSESIKEFWRTHQDEFWPQIEEEKFTKDQLNSIKQTTRPTYFI